jgi:hypothetical protein
MSEQISQAALQAMYAQETEEVVLPRLTIAHPNLIAPVRVVRDAVPMIVGSNTVVDMTGNSRDGVVHGAPTWVRSLVGGGAGSALRFTALDADYVLTPSFSVGSTWTIEAATALSALAPNAPNTQAVLAFSNWPTIEIQATGRPTVSWKDSGGVVRSITAPSEFTLPLNRSVHLAAVHAGSTTTLFVDGVQAVQTELYDSAAVSGTLRLGGRPIAGRGLHGVVSEVRIWNRARSAKEISDQQATMIDGNEPGLLAYYPMNDGCFLPYPFDLTEPDDVTDEIPQVQITIDNVDRSIVNMLRSLSSPPTVTLEVVLASSPNHVEHGPFTLHLRKADYDALVVNGTLDFGDELETAFPAHTMTPTTCPGLF